MSFTRILAVFAVILAVLPAIPAQSTPSAGAVMPPVGHDERFMPVAELREGMRGRARTVFRGSEHEEFGVEILGVLPGAIGPKQDLIVGRLSGGPVDRTGVFAGMSGSPVYIDGRLIGAISYSFPFAKEPICGITPIEQMIAIFEQKTPAPAAAEPRAVSFAELVSTVWSPELPRAAGPAGPSTYDNPKIAAVSGQAFRPISTPMTFSGFSQQTLDLFAPQLMQAGLLPVSAAGGAAEISPLKKADAATLVGGDSVSMQLARGDLSLAASGTVTLRSGEKIYAFGHPFLGLGSSDLPMSESHVVTVVPNVNNSFKLAVPDSMVGSMTQDRATGVFGKLGQTPKMIPVRINLRTSRGHDRTLNFEVVNDDFLTPLLLNIGIYNTLIATERGLGDSTIELSGEISIAGNEPVKLGRRLSGAQASQFTAAAVAVPVSALLRSRFADLEISAINIDLRSSEGNRMAMLERLTIDRVQAKVGETVELQAFVRSAGGRVYVERIPVQIPAETPPGALSIVVGDGAALQQNAVIQQFVPRSAAEMIRTMNRLKLPDRLYVQAVRSSSGAVVGASEMPNLPPSVLATLNNDRTVGGFKPYVQTMVSDREVPPADFIVAGQQGLSIQVIR